MGKSLDNNAEKLGKKQVELLMAVQNELLVKRLLDGGWVGRRVKVKNAE